MKVSNGTTQKTVEVPVVNITLSQNEKDSLLRDIEILQVEAKRGFVELIYPTDVLEELYLQLRSL